MLTTQQLIEMISLLYRNQVGHNCSYYLEHVLNILILIRLVTDDPLN
jgi:hypothetical protein